MKNIILSTTGSIDLPGVEITQYLGLVTGDTVIGANVFRDFFAKIRDVVGGRSGSYERVLTKARESALGELVEQARAIGADAVVGIKFDFSSAGAANSMFMVSVTGTAVRLNRSQTAGSKSFV